MIASEHEHLQDKFARARRSPGQDQIDRINTRAFRPADIIILRARRRLKVPGSGRYQTYIAAAMLRVSFGMRLFEPVIRRTAQVELAA